MARKAKSLLDQLEDALLKLGPLLGGFIGGVIGIGLLGKWTPRFVAFAVGGAIGGALVFGVIQLVFYLLNPSRSRGGRRK